MKNKANKKNIYMILTNGFDPDVRVYKEAKYLVEKGFNVEILCWDRSCLYVDKPTDIVDGIKIKRFFLKSSYGSGLHQLFPFYRFVREVRKYLKNKTIDYLHCHDFDGLVVGSMQHKKVSIIFDMHEIYTNYAYAKNKLFGMIFSHFVSKAKYIIYVNDEQLKGIKNNCKKIYLPNYPSKEYYIPSNKTKSKSIRVNYIGSVRDYDAIYALSKIKSNNIEFGIYGSGVKYETLKSNINSDNVHFYGKYNGINEIGDIYRKTDLLYCSYNPDVTNWKYAYPVKLYESIVTDTPIIVSKNTVSSDFVNENGIGISIDYCDSKSIEEAILKITKNIDYYKKNLMKIKEFYSWDVISKNLLEIYGDNYENKK